MATTGLQTPEHTPIMDVKSILQSMDAAITQAVVLVGVAVDCMSTDEANREHIGKSFGLGMNPLAFGDIVETDTTPPPAVTPVPEVRKSAAPDLAKMRDYSDTDTLRLAINRMYEDLPSDPLAHFN